VVQPFKSVSVAHAETSPFRWKWDAVKSATPLHAGDDAETPKRLTSYADHWIMIDR